MRRSLGGEVQVEIHSNKIILSIRALASVVLVFIVEIKLNSLAHWESATSIEVRCAPLAELALVKSFRSKIGDEVVGRDGNRPFCR